ncbi:MAG TPA: efflux RND transporter permease subunit [Edaphobacter sp.]|nr:efflux RND transporter permease subunit [Edaphobacter sp.]
MGSDHCLPAARRQHYRDGQPHPDQTPFPSGHDAAGIKTTVVLDRTVTIRASVHDVERTLILSIVLVVLVVFLFLRDPRATISFRVLPFRFR